MEFMKQLHGNIFGCSELLNLHLETLHETPVGESIPFPNPQSSGCGEDPEGLEISPDAEGNRNSVLVVR